MRFRHGRGCVYHLISHVELQRAESMNATARSGADFLRAKGARSADISADVSAAEVQAAFLSVALVSRVLAAGR